MSETEKLNEVINDLDLLKQKLVELKLKISGINYEKGVKHLFKKLAEIVNSGYIGSVIFIDNKNVKYISYDPRHNGFSNYIIYNNKAYYWFKFKYWEKQIEILYTMEYNISNDILEMLNEMQESDIDYADVSYFKLYYLLKKGYKINFVKD